MAEYIEREQILGYMDLVVIHARGVAGNDSILKKVTDIVENMRHLVAEAPSADVVPVVRCKDCKHCSPDEYEKDLVWCSCWHDTARLEDFCSYGERKEAEGNG